MSIPVVRFECCCPREQIENQYTQYSDHEMPSVAKDELYNTTV